MVREHRAPERWSRARCCWLLAPERAPRAWLVTTTAQPNSSARRRRKRPRLFWRAASSPRPTYSTRYSAVTLSTTISAKRASDIMDAAAMSSWPWWSVLCARAYATLSSTSLGLSPYLAPRRGGRSGARSDAYTEPRGRLPTRGRAGAAHLSAICMRRCGRKVPSVSMYIALPSPPPMSMGSCTQGQPRCRQGTFVHLQRQYEGRRDAPGR